MYPSNQMQIIYTPQAFVVEHMRDVRTQIISVILWIFALPAFLYGQTVLHPYENTRFLKAYATLQQPSAQVNENVSLRNTLQSMESALNIAIWLDRRIDGEQLIQLKPGQRTHLECLQELCSQTNTEIAWLENIIYIAPSHQSSRIETAYWKLMTDRVCEAWRKKGTSIQWNEPREVKSIIEEHAKSLPVKIEGLDSIDHDLWAPATIPESSLAAQSTCLLSGFDRSLESVNRQQFKIVELPKASEVAFEYSSNQMQKIKPAQLQAWKTAWPAAKIKAIGVKGIAAINAPVAAHRALALAGQADKIGAFNKPAPFDDSRYTLDYDGELEKLVGTLGKQIGLTIVPWPLDATLAKRMVKIHVKEVSLDELLAAIAKQSDLRIKRTDKSVSIE